MLKNRLLPALVAELGGVPVVPLVAPLALVAVADGRFRLLGLGKQARHREPPDRYAGSFLLRKQKMLF